MPSNSDRSMQALEKRHHRKSFFWSHTTFGFYYPLTNERLEVHCRWVNLQLDRANSFHVRLDIYDIARAAVVGMVPTVEATFRRLVKNLSRCISVDMMESKDHRQSLDCDPSVSAMCSRFEALFTTDGQGELPRLQTLAVQNYIGCNNSDPTPAVWLPLLKLRSSPSLKKLSISGTRFDLIPSLDWSIWQTLQLERCQFIPSHLLTSLHAARRNLTHLKLILQVTTQESKFDQQRSLSQSVWIGYCLAISTFMEPAKHQPVV